ncbi:methyl-accepting chemotaxis protein [Yoonia vestfoldensis]|uniref:Methyl-accepting chemotaxis protein McpD n=1 Tax=Yoonia vestfoldensis SKA53 TaxID=314232 RepID=A3V6J3_9RHOB|nr:methyl-accepting chemotaxis protein [Yoonia vestfoldensis]EAQ06517.1 methyl-accepting chemotaxis protein McpD [Yoonia vestfoldensis SKA53]
MLARWSVAWRINSGFVVLALLIIALSVAAVRAVDNLRSDFATSGQIAAQNMAVGGFIRQMQAAERTVRAYGAAPTDAMAQAVAAHLAALRDNPALSAAFAPSTAARTEIDAVLALAQDYATTFTQIRDLRAAATNPGIALQAKVQDMHGALRSITNSVGVSGRPQLVQAAQTAMHSFDTATLHLDSYLALRNDDDGRAARAALDTFGAAMAQLAQAGAGAYLQNQIAQIADAVPALITDLDRYAASMTQADRLESTVLAPLGQLVLDRLNALLRQIAQAGQAHDDASASLLADLRKLIPMMGLLTALLALLAGYLVARGITHAITRLVEATNRLAAGDTATAVTGGDTDHGLGRLALGLDAIRATQIAQANADAAQNAQQRDQQQVIDMLQSQLVRLAAGDLTVQIDQPFAPAHDNLRQDFNRATDALRALIGQMSQTAGLVAVQTRQATSATAALSQRIEKQATTLDQTSAALGQLTASLRAVAGDARTVDSTVTAARAQATNNSDVVAQAVAAMAKIGDSSQQMSQVIGVIEDIAFQTNLLALNAGVEAARAGDEGRGFAVVAAEVRTLAQKSAEAAKQITALIARSGKQVQRGTDLVGTAGSALSDISTQVGEIAALTTRIAAGTQDQATALSRITTGVTELDQMTQHQSTMIHDARTRGAQLDQAAAMLTDLTGRFATGRTPAPLLTETAIIPLEAAIGRTSATLLHPPFKSSQRKAPVPDV